MSIPHQNSRYDTIGQGYDATRKADTYLCQRIYHQLNPESGNKYLDVGCGTGNYTIALKKKGIEITGVDPSILMLKKAENKDGSIRWVQGSAENLPFPSDCFDGVLVSLSIHHWNDLEKGFLEIARVLKKGGKIVLFSSLPEQTKNYWLSHYFPKMIKDSADVLPSFERIKKVFEMAGIRILSKERYFVRPDLEDLFLFSGKHDPELYFDENIRNGISSFSLLSNQLEVEKGLLKLRSDIDSGRIKDVMQQFENELGDYILITGITTV